MLSSWHEEMIFISISFFTPPFVLSFFFLFEKRLKCKISIKKKALQTAPQENHFAGDIVTSCDLLSSPTFFADLFVT